MTVSFVFVSIVLSFLLLSFALITKDDIIGMLSGIVMFCVGIYISIYNIESINNLLTQGLSVVLIWVGLFIFIDISKTKIEDIM